MEVKINVPANDDVSFYREVVNIAWQYKKIRKKPETKLHNMKNEAAIYFAISVIIATFSVAYLMVRGSNSMTIMLMAVMLVCAVMSLWQMNMISKMVKSYQKSAGDSILTLSEESITLEKIGDQALSLNWNNAMFIRFFHETICMMSKEEPVVMLVLGINHKDEIMNFINENHIDIRVIE